ncbi:DUF4232 domain-containing protein [Saccharopolyspora oryzae]|uniref:DUF4232 domain-containing protein n=1 Tax=Saccharopolyspora oryzae TaxID=2997343 RepID=A0ABT4URL4_9PSEU|nr:DUF4232 domain-containing protein [Saccharopolyspora oryzae]MDA3624356.1 DUF4232 domain-containing protein [Saccharopolyspora oryzae]
MRKRLVGATVVLAAGLALSGCSGGSGSGHVIGSADPQVDNQTVASDAAQPETDAQQPEGKTESSGDNGLSGEDRPCTGRDLTVAYQSGEVAPSGGEGKLTATKKDANDPCVLSNYPELRLLDESGKPVSTTVQHGLQPAPSRVPMPGPAYDMAMASLKWTTSEGCGTTPAKLAVNFTASDDWSDAAEVPVNTSEQDAFSALCAGSAVDVSAFEAGVS